MENMEVKLLGMIKDLYQEAKDIEPEDGFSSPRDIDLVRKQNKIIALMDRLQDAMRLFNPEFEIREN